MLNSTLCVSAKKMMGLRNGPSLTTRQPKREEKNLKKKKLYRIYNIALRLIMHINEICYENRDEKWISKCFHNLKKKEQKIKWNSNFVLFFSLNEPRHQTGENIRIHTGIYIREYDLVCVAAHFFFFCCREWIYIFVIIILLHSISIYYLFKI